VLGSILIGRKKGKRMNKGKLKGRNKNLRILKMRKIIEFQKLSD